MHPILFSVNGFSVYTYGVLMALAILLGMLWFSKRGTHIGLSSEAAYSSAFLIILFGLLGARLWYLLYHPEWLMTPLKILTERGGLVWYGGVIGGIIAALVIIKRKNYSLWGFGDAIILPLILGLAIGRIGCFMTGCCFGEPCHLPWAVQFPPGHETFAQWVHPTQLYESLGAMVMIGLFLLWEKHKAYRAGQLFTMFLIGYGFLRFGIESLRADTVSVGIFSSSQWISLLSMLLGTLFFIVITFPRKIHQAGA